MILCQKFVRLKQNLKIVLTNNWLVKWLSYISKSFFFGSFTLKVCFHEQNFYYHRFFFMLTSIICLLRLVMSFDLWKHSPLCLCSAQEPVFCTSIHCWRDHSDRYTGGPSAHCSTRNICPSLMGLSEIVSEF